MISCAFHPIGEEREGGISGKEGGSEGEREKERESMCGVYLCIFIFMYVCAHVHPQACAGWMLMRETSCSPTLFIKARFLN